MTNIYNDLIYYNNFFSGSTISVKEQAATIKWSERKCYVFKFFINNLSEGEIEKIKNKAV